MLPEFWSCWTWQGKPPIVALVGNNWVAVFFDFLSPRLGLPLAWTVVSVVVGDAAVPASGLAVSQVLLLTAIRGGLWLGLNNTSLFGGILPAFFLAAALWSAAVLVGKGATNCEGSSIFTRETESIEGRNEGCLIASAAAAALLYIDASKE